MWSQRASALLDAALASREPRHLLGFTAALAALMLAQFAYGLAADSLGLVSDAFHMAFHGAATATSLWGMLHARQAPSFAFSYGYERYEVLAAFSSALLLVFVCVFVLGGAAHRLLLLEPRAAALAAAAAAARLARADTGAGAGAAAILPAAGGGLAAALADPALWFGVLGVLLNVLGAALLGPGQGSVDQLVRYQAGGGAGGARAGGGGAGGGAGAYGKGASASALLPTTSSASSASSSSGSRAGGAGAGSLNARAVSLHVYADAFSSACVVAAALARHCLGLRQADTLQAAVVACFTLWIAVPLFRVTGMVLLQTTPSALRAPLERCRQETLTVAGVLEVLDERFWQQSAGLSVGSLTVRVRGDAAERDVLERVRRIYGRFVSDLTVQVEKDPKLAWLNEDGGAAGGEGGGAGGGGGGGESAAVSVR